MVGVCLCSRAPIKQQTDKHKLVTHNLGDIGKVRGSVTATLTLLISPILLLLLIYVHLRGPTARLFINTYSYSGRCVYVVCRAHYLH